jgi:hypothetical protein
VIGGSAIDIVMPTVRASIVMMAERSGGHHDRCRARLARDRENNLFATEIVPRTSEIFTGSNDSRINGLFCLRIYFGLALAFG